MISGSSISPLVTIFNDKSGGRIKAARAMDLAEIERVIRAAKPAPTKNELSLLKLAAFGDIRTPKNSLRHDENVVGVHGIEGDYDGESVPMSHAAEALSVAGLAAMLYTSASHSPEKPRWRVLVFLSAPLEGTTEQLREQHRHWTGTLNAVLGGVLKGESFALSQCYYFGRIEGRPDPEIIRLSGVCIDQMEHPPAPLYPKSGKSNGSAKHKRDVIGEDRSADLLARVRKLVREGKADHEIHVLQAQHPHVLDQAEGRRAIDRAITKAREYSVTEMRPPRDAVKQGPTAVITSAASIQPSSIEHLWPNVLYIGKPTLIVGDPGLGKSLGTADIAARTSTGKQWPLGGANAGPGDVLMCSAEDDPGDTIVPRLIAAGADLNRIEFFDGVREETEDGGTTIKALALDRHLEQIREIAARKKGALKLLIVDPIAAFLGATDSHKNGEIRGLIAGLARMASDYRFSVLVVSHLNKGTGASAIYRVTGSLAFVAAARAVFTVVRDPKDPARRLMLPVKNNLALDTSGFSYCIKVAGNDAPYVEWGAEAVTEETAEEILSGAASTPRQEAVNTRVREVMEWLKQALAVEAQPATSMWRLSEQKGFSRRDMERAKRELGITASAKGYRGAWHWELPK